MKDWYLPFGIKVPAIDTGIKLQNASKLGKQAAFDEVEQILKSKESEVLEAMKSKKYPENVIGWFSFEGLKPYQQWLLRGAIIGKLPNK